MKVKNITLYVFLIVLFSSFSFGLFEPLTPPGIAKIELLNFSSNYINVGELEVDNLSVLGTFIKTNVQDYNVTGNINITGCIEYSNGVIDCGEYRIQPIGLDLYGNLNLTNHSITNVHNISGASPITILDDVILDKFIYGDGRYLTNLNISRVNQTLYITGDLNVGGITTLNSTAYIDGEPEVNDATLVLLSGSNLHSCINLTEGGALKTGFQICNDGSGTNRFVISNLQTGVEYFWINRDTGEIVFNNITSFTDVNIDDLVVNNDLNVNNDLVVDRNSTFNNNVNINENLTVSGIINGVNYIEKNTTITIIGNQGSGTIYNNFLDLSAIQVAVFPISSNNTYKINVTAQNGIKTININNINYTGNIMLPYQADGDSNYINISFNNVTINENMFVRVRWLL